jgi:hypothetical protein
MQPSPSVPVAYRPPFAFGAMPWRDARPHGESILEIVRSVPNLPREFDSRGIVCINGEPVPRELWSYTRPKQTTDNLPIAVTLHFPLGSPGGGGGGSSAKSIIGLVAAVALIAVASFITGGGAAIFLGYGSAGLFAAGSTSALLLAGAVSVAGALAISALTAPPTQAEAAQIADTNTDNRDPASAQGNVISPGGSIPRVIGSRKVYPPFICEPLVELVDDDEFVEGLFALNGPHSLTDVRIDGVDIGASEDIEYETFEGWSTDAAPALVTRQGRTITPQLTLSQYTLASDNINLDFQTSPEESLPLWHSVVTRDSPDEVWIHLLFAGGLSLSGTTQMAIPFRIRMRRRGDEDWINLPEMHYMGNTTKQLRAAILLKWTEALPIVSVPGLNGFYYAHRAPIAQTAAPATPTAWVADDYFDDGVGNNYYYHLVESASRVRNINLYKNRAEVYLDAATFIPGIYEIQIKRGYAYQASSFNGSTYVYSGHVRDFFWYEGTAAPIAIGQNQSNVSDRALLTRVVSVWNEAPYVPNNKYFALIAVRARNRQIQRLSVQAAGFVRDWNESGWLTWTTTSNPAPHYVDVLSGEQNLDPLDTDLRDDDGLVEWRNLCDDNEWTCDAIIDDMRTQDCLALLASCGYAKPYQSDTYGVTVDNDRTAESPVQVFSRVNASNVKFEKAFIRAPQGFIVTYRNEESDDDRAQTIVYQSDPSMATTGLFESLSYDGLIDEGSVRARARFDLDQANLRSTFYSLDTDIESIVCRRGSLVALQHDVLTSRCGDGHIYTKTVIGGSITTVTLDAEVAVISGNTGVAIRHTDGSITTHAISNGTGDTAVLTFSTPIADNGTITGFDQNNREYGSLVVVGELASEYKRMLVAQITATKDLKASMVLVDEAPELVRFDGG